MMPSIKRLSMVNEVIQTGMAAAQSVFGLIDETPEADPGTQEIARANGRIEYGRWDSATRYRTRRCWTMFRFASSRRDPGTGWCIRQW